METQNAAAARRVPWNKGKLTGQKPPLKLPEIWAIRTRLQMYSNARELAMFNLGSLAATPAIEMAAIRNIGNRLSLLAGRCRQLHLNGILDHIWR